MISAVSGGSVGTMYYAANYESLQSAGVLDASVTNTADKNQPKISRQIIERAGSSGLEAVGWGLVFRDLPATLPWMIGPEDRGTVLDACWQSRLHLNPNASSPNQLGDWQQPMLQGKMPIVVFNSTEVESGRQTLFSPVQTVRRASLDNETGAQAASVEFSRTFKKNDIAIVTAARLSATFPYVSPTATTKSLQELGHMADGGYVDNEGILTAVDWISKLLDHYAATESGAAPFDRILLLRIRHVIADDPLYDATEEDKKHARDGFMFAAFGPLKAILTVRSASQVVRGQVEVDLLSGESAEAKNKPMAEETGRINSRDQKLRVPFETKFVDFNLGESITLPLSWKLSPKEFARYEQAWQRLEREEKEKKEGSLLKEIDDKYFNLRKR